MKAITTILLIVIGLTVQAQLYFPTGKGWKYTPKIQSDSVQITKYFKFDNEIFKWTPTPQDGQFIMRVLKPDGSHVWTNSTPCFKTINGQPIEGTGDITITAGETLTPTNGILQWNGTDKRYMPYPTKLASDPNYPYFYLSGGNPSYFANPLYLDAPLYAGSFIARNASQVNQSASLLNYQITATNTTNISSLGGNVRTTATHQSQSFMLSWELPNYDNIYFGFGRYTDSSPYKNVIRSERQAFPMGEKTYLPIYIEASNLILDKYGKGNVTGTPAYNLQVDASGMIIETPVGEGGGGTPAPDTYVTGLTYDGTTRALTVAQNNGTAPLSVTLPESGTAGETVTANNGLTKTGSNIALGGNVLPNTETVVGYSALNDGVALFPPAVGQVLNSSEHTPTLYGLVSVPFSGANANYTQGISALSQLKVRDAPSSISTITSKLKMEGINDMYGLAEKELSVTQDASHNAESLRNYQRLYLENTPYDVTGTTNAIDQIVTATTNELSFMKAMDSGAMLKVQMPDVFSGSNTRYMPVSVNGQYADNTGNITVTTGSSINTSVQTLSGTTVTWDILNGINAKITLTGSTTITLTNLTAGMTGNLTVTNATATSGYALNFAGFTNRISPAVYEASNRVKTSGQSRIDCFSWYYDGTYLIWNGTNDYN